jgi:hypothetical protein
MFSIEPASWPIIDLIDPINNAGNVSVTPTFVWNCTTSEYPYHIQVSANPDFSELLINEIVDVETYESSIELDSTTQYWWRVGIETMGIIFGRIFGLLQQKLNLLWKLLI